MNRRHLIGSDLNLLLIFDAIWRERSITKAANWLRVTQPAVSHALGRLLMLADDPLFVKGGSGVIPTPRAEAIALDVSKALDHAIVAIQPPEDFDPATVTAILRLGLTNDATWAILPPIIRALNGTAPGLEVRGLAIDTRTPLADLDDEVVDFTIRPIGDLPERFCSDPILEDHLICVADDTGDMPDTKTLELYQSRPHLVISYDDDPKS